MSAQELGALTAKNAGPRGFKTLLLEKLRAAGVPVDGVLEPKLAHGAVYKVRGTEPADFFRYIWLPEELDVTLQRFGASSGLPFDADASAVV